VANPVPEPDELAEATYERALSGALEEVQAQAIRGRDVTPRMLDHMRKVTGGDAVRANVALLLDNARVAGALAAAMSRA